MVFLYFLKKITQVELFFLHVNSDWKLILSSKCTVKSLQFNLYNSKPNLLNVQEGINFYE